MSKAPISPFTLDGIVEIMKPHHDRVIAEHRATSAERRLDLAWERINALGGYVAPDDVAWIAVRNTITKALDIIEALGGRDPATRRDTNSTVKEG